MKPTTEQILSALNKIIRESQKPKKVELGIADDVKKIEKEVFSVDEKLILKNILSPLRKGITEINKIIKLEGQLEKSLNKAKSQLKELGISEKNIKWVEDGESTLRYIDDTKSLLKTLEKTEKSLAVN